MQKMRNDLACRHVKGKEVDRDRVRCHEENSTGNTEVESIRNDDRTEQTHFDSVRTSRRHHAIVLDVYSYPTLG